MAVQICPERHLRVPKFCAPFSRLAPGGSTKKWPLQRWQWNCGTGNSAQSCRAWGRSAGGPWFVSLVVFSACFCNIYLDFPSQIGGWTEQQQEKKSPKLKEAYKEFCFPRFEGSSLSNIFNAVQICPERGVQVHKFHPPFSFWTYGGSFWSWIRQGSQWSFGTGIGIGTRNSRARERSASWPWFVSWSCLKVVWKI